jgi:hypothetical protein
VIPQQSPEETLGSRTIPLGLEIDIYHLAILINSPPQVLPLAVDLHKDFIDAEGIAVASALPLQSAGIDGTELDAEPAP